jgi:hypothetical protein
MLWTFFWPAFAAGVVIGAIAGLRAFRQPRRNATNRHLADAEIVANWKRKRNITFAAGAAASLAASLLWCGPIGAADAFASRVELGARQALTYYEMTKVTARLQRRPLSRDLVLAGPADDFQRSELVRLFGQLPGVNAVSWSGRRGGLPLVAESGLLAIAGFLLGLVLAYLVELRRRHNAQWKW